jgi:hypothetical protein
MLSASEIAATFSGCNGESKRLIRDDVKYRVAGIGAAGLSSPVIFWSDSFKNCLLTEADRYLDRSLFNICAAKNLVEEGKLSWAVVTFYYASFYAVNGLVRLQAESYSRVESRFYHLQPEDLTADTFRLRSGDKKRSHEATWYLFDRLYGGFNWGSGYYRPVLKPSNKLWDLEKRHIANYDIAGYEEMYWSSDRLRRESKARWVDVLDNLTKSLNEDDLAIETRALLRIQLLVELLSFIASRSSYRSFFDARQARRRTLVNGHLTNGSLRAKIVSWLV